VLLNAFIKKEEEDNKNLETKIVVLVRVVDT